MESQNSKVRFLQGKCIFERINTFQFISGKPIFVETFFGISDISDRPYFYVFFLQVTQIDCYSLAKGDIAYHKRYELYTFESEFEKIICSFSLLIFSI